LPCISEARHQTANSMKAKAKNSKSDHGTEIETANANVTKTTEELTEESLVSSCVGFVTFVFAVPGSLHVLKQFLGVVVFDFGFVMDDVVIRRFEKLFTAVAKLFADELLHAGIVEFALSGRLFGD